MSKLLPRLHRLAGRRSSRGFVAKMTGHACWVAFLTLVVYSSPAADRRRARCVARFWLWQVRRRVVARPICLVFAGGWQMELPPWSELAGITAATGFHEPIEELFALSFLRPGDTLIDVGANVGVYTVGAASQGARVVAVEPSTAARAVLERNVGLNGLDANVRVLPVALGDHSGMVRLTTDGDVGNRLVDDGHAGSATESVSVRPLDVVVAENADWLDDRGRLLLKVDVEGQDLAVLHGGRMTLAERRPVVLVETWDGGVEVRALLSELGYRVYRYDITSRTLAEYPTPWTDHANFIAVADEAVDEARQRVRESPPPVFGPPRVRWR